MTGAHVLFLAMVEHELKLGMYFDQQKIMETNVQEKCPEPNHVILPNVRNQVKYFN